MHSENQARLQAYSAEQVQARSKTVPVAAKPDKNHERKVCSWRQSWDSCSEAQRVELSEQNKQKFVISYMSGEELQLWELLTLHSISINWYLSLKKKPQNHFESVTRELSAGIVSIPIKQLSRQSNLQTYEHVFSKYISQGPSLSALEQTLHYSQRMNNRVPVEVERSKTSSGQEAMIVAGRTESVISSSYRCFWTKNQLQWKRCSRSTNADANWKHELSTK